MIKYTETIDRGFQRKDLGNDSVWFDEFGYEWFVTEKIVCKLKKGSITANWCPDTKTIEVMRLIDGTVKSRKSFKTIEEFDYLDSFLNPNTNE
jgi:hypothetical protein